jgi:polysaccharide biosynthesis transport protein
MDPLKPATTPENKLHFLDYWRIIRIRKTVILSVFLLVLITATLVTFVLPQSYYSHARIRVDRDSSDIGEFGSTSMRNIYDPYFIQTEFEAIRSEVVLGRVIEALDLNREWGKRYNNNERLKTTETLEILRGRLDLRPVRNTMFIEIGVYSEKPEEAARIANAVADAYKLHRLEQFMSASEGGIKALKAEFNEHRAAVAAMSQKLEDLKKKHKINEAEASGNSFTPSLDWTTVQDLNRMLTDGKSQLDREERLLMTLTNLDRTRLIAAIPAIPNLVSDLQFGELSQQLNLAEQALIKIRRDAGAENPAVKTAEELVADLRQKLDARVDGVLLGLQTKVESLRRGVISIQERLDQARSNDIARAEETREFWETKRDFDQLLSFGRILENRLKMQEVDKSLPRTGMVYIMDNAVPGVRPVKPNKTLNIVLGVVIGLVVGIGLAFFIEYLDTSVKTIDDVERALQAPVLGVIPQNVGLLIKEGAESPHAEAYRVLRTNLLFSRKDEKLNSLCVVSAGAGEGKSTTVFNLATIFAQSGQRVVIVDSDLRRPTLHKMVAASNAIGLTNYLLKQNSLEEVIQRTSIPTLDFMASGKLPSSSMGILSSAQMKDLISELKQRYDFVFFDSPPIMGVSDASILASEVDMTMQVIQYRRYPQPMNIRAKQMIEKVGGNLVGIVLNNINMSQDESYYYYSGYYHDYYYTKSEDAEEKPAAKAADGQPKVDIKPKY